jgi:hypothetical protein
MLALLGIGGRVSHQLDEMLRVWFKYPRAPGSLELVDPVRGKLRTA